MNKIRHFSFGKEKGKYEPVVYAQQRDSSEIISRIRYVNLIIVCSIRKLQTLRHGVMK